MLLITSPMASARERTTSLSDCFSAEFFQRFRPLTKGARRIHDVVDHDCGLAFDVADQIHDFRLTRLWASFLDNRDACMQTVGKHTRARYAAKIG